MTCNVGRTERIIRGVLGLALIGIGWLADIHGGWRAAALVIGGISLATALVGFCPLWEALGINTCSKVRTGTDRDR